MAMASPLKRKGWRSSFVLSTNRLTKRRLQPTAESAAAEPKLSGKYGAVMTICLLKFLRDPGGAVCAGDTEVDEYFHATFLLGFFEFPQPAREWQA
jgi:hypothetical protein